MKVAKSFERLEWRTFQMLRISRKWFLRKGGFFSIIKMFVVTFCSPLVFSLLNQQTLEIHDKNSLESMASSSSYLNEDGQLLNFTWNDTSADLKRGQGGGPIFTQDDSAWVISACFIIFGMQTGFGMLESGNLHSQKYE